MRIDYSGLRFLSVQIFLNSSIIRLPAGDRKLLVLVVIPIFVRYRPFLGPTISSLSSNPPLVASVWGMKATKSLLQASVFINADELVVIIEGGSDFEMAVNMSLPPGSRWTSATTQG